MQGLSHQGQPFFYRDSLPVFVAAWCKEIWKPSVCINRDAGEVLETLF